jgi:hypothetical protein
MKTIKLLLLLTLTTLLLYSCTKEGPAGPAGTNGTNGKDGTNGTNGTNGKNGNANVTVISLLKADITWTAGTYLGRAANTFALTNTAVNANIIDHGTVLGYGKLTSGWYPMPFYWETSDGTSRQCVTFTYALNNITLWSWQTSGVLNPSATSEFRFLLITDNTVTPSKGASVSSEILYNLSKAGVDVNNYYAVMDYFGLDY